MNKKMSNKLNVIASLRRYSGFTIWLEKHSSRLFIGNTLRKWHFQYTKIYGRSNDNFEKNGQVVKPQEPTSLMILPTIHLNMSNCIPFWCRRLNLKVAWVDIIYRFVFSGLFLTGSYTLYCHRQVLLTCTHVYFLCLSGRLWHVVSRS